VTIQDLGSVGELVGAIATVATLFYLATQIRSSTRAMRSASAQSVHESFATWYRMIASDGELSELTTKGLRDSESLTEAEKGRFVSTAMALLLCSQDAFIKWRGVVVAGSLARLGVRDDEPAPRPGRAGFCQERSYLYGGAFRDYTQEHVLKRDAHPEARPLGVFPIGVGPTPGGGV
jgi:alkylated DNA nucleotide flippase Atl1